MSDKVRLSLDVSPETNIRLDALAGKLGGSKSEVLRKAIALIEVATEAKEKGQRLALADSDNKVVTNIVGL
jgi:predicted transcriptional regulator